MNTTTLRRKRVIIPTVAAAVLLGGGGAFWAATAASDDVRGGDRDRVADAAVEHVGGGTAVDVETSDDPGEAFEVEVRKDDGTEVDVTLDQDLTVLASEDDRESDDTDDEARPVTAQQRASAERAALAAVGSGRVLKVEASDDAPEAYEVDVVDGSRSWDVELDADFQVLSTSRDD